MAKRPPSFNFGANVRPKKTKAAKSSGKSSSGKSGGKKPGAWQKYVGGA